jgi:hypothetical protein
MENIEVLINELEDEILNARKSLIGNNVVINGEKVLELVRRVREALPDSIIEANSIVGRTEAVYRDAQLKANEIIAAARANADNMIRNSEIVKSANDEADLIRSQALQQKEKADYAARRRVDELLESTETSIAEALMVIRNERDAIWDGIKKK